MSKQKKVIVILQRGWVFVGDLTKNGTTCRLDNAANVRRWGTSKGLGQLAAEGPTSSTQLDPCPPVTFHELTAVATLECNGAAWKQK